MVLEAAVKLLVARKACHRAVVETTRGTDIVSATLLEENVRLAYELLHMKSNAQDHVRPSLGSGRSVIS